MSNVGAAVATDNIATVLANKAVLVPLSRCFISLFAFILLDLRSLFGFMFVFRVFARVSSGWRFLLSLGGGFLTILHRLDRGVFFTVLLFFFGFFRLR